jgi:Fic family protein
MQRPIASAGSLAKQTELTFVTANRALANLQELGIVTELTGQRRNRLFSDTRYIDALARGTDPLIR